MAVIDKVSNVGATEVHANLDVWKRVGGITIPEWYLDHVQELPVDPRRLHAAVDLEIVLGQYLEMDLVEVEFMMFRRAVLDGPVLDRTLPGDDGRRVIGVEEHRSCSVHGNKKVRGAVGIGRIRNYLREIQRPM